MIGIEPSAEQLAHAATHPRVEYRVATAEATGLTDAAADLLLAAQAFHWFERDGFFAEARRVVRPGGVLALVSYALSRITPEVDAVVDELYRSLDPYWEPERRMVEDGYASARRAVPGALVSALRDAQHVDGGRPRRLPGDVVRPAQGPGGRGSESARRCWPSAGGGVG